MSKETEVANNIHILEMSKYTSPIVLENKNTEYVSYGADNDYFSYLIKRHTNSTTNNAVINSIVDMIFGKGLDALDSNRKPEQYAQAISLFKKSDIKRFTNDRKKLGMSALKIQYKGEKVSKVSHFPMETLRAQKMDEEGVIKNWFYHPNWSEYKKSDKLKPIPAFGTSNKRKTEVFVLTPYVSGFAYYPPVDYQGSLPYSVLEEEIGDYLINDTINGFSGTKVVNFNNGIPAEEKQRAVKKDVLKTFTGATGNKVIVAFNKNPDAKTTVDNIPLDNAPEHYQYLSTEAESKILKGHKAPSWLLGANSGKTGLGSNADEIKNSMLVFDNLVIKPYQEEIIDVLDENLAVNGVSLKLYFKTIQPLEFIDTDGLDKETKEEETGVKENLCKIELSKEGNDFIDNEVADDLLSKADDDLEGWEEVDEREVDYDLEGMLDARIEELNAEGKGKLSLRKMLINLVSTGTARPNSKSAQDKEVKGNFYKVRYRYYGSRSPQRIFCQKMMNAGKLYRKEDIIGMENKVVNAGFGEGGSNKYSVWLYKGGARCKHGWRRVTFKSTSKSVDTKSPKANKVGTRQAEIGGFKVTNPYQVSVFPNNLPNKGFSPRNSNLPADSQ